jgi:hypoxia up-regulated 1
LFNHPRRCCCRRHLLHNFCAVRCSYNQSGVTTLRFEADYSSLLHFSSAECIVELDVTEDKVIEVPVPANVTDAAAANATDAAGNKHAAAAADDDKDAAADKKDAAESEKSKDEQQEEGTDKKKNDDEAAAGGDAANATDAATAVNKTVFVKKTIQVTRRKVFHVSKSAVEAMW